MNEQRISKLDNWVHTTIKNLTGKIKQLETERNRNKEERDLLWLGLSNEDSHVIQRVTKYVLDHRKLGSPGPVDIETYYNAILSEEEDSNES